MKYKTLIEKNSEPNLTEGRLTTPPPTTPPLCQHHSPPPHSRYRLPTRQRCIYAGQEDRGELEKNACAENTIEACSAKTCDVNERALLLLVLFQLLHGKFRTCRIVTFIHFSHRSSANKAFSFFLCSRLYPCQ